MSKPQKKGHPLRGGHPTSICPEEGRADSTAIPSPESVKTRRITEAEFDFLIVGAALHWYGVRLTTKTEVDALRSKFAKSVKMPEHNDDWRPVMERGIELMRGINRMRAMGGDLDGRC